MDNLCHSLAGAAIAQSGFARRLPRATLLGVIAANIPDVDALTYVWTDAATAVSFRRGWTHGVLAVAVWTVLLSVAFGWWSRRRTDIESPSVDGWTGDPTTAGESHGWTAYVPLSAIAVGSHPALDWLNSYGIRLLMPFSDRWFYGDALFIVDPPMLVLFAAGWFVSSRALKAGSPHPHRAARAALAAAATYIVVMKTMSVATRSATEAQFGLTDASARELMVAPRPLMWLRRDVVVTTSATYDRYPATWSGWRPEIGERLWSDSIGVTPEVEESVRATRDGSRFLRWSRFPYFVPGTGPDVGTIFVGDLRYSAGTVESWAGIRVRASTPAMTGHTEVTPLPRER